jgi:glycosyltransferase involved in cell wall biosynthesis
MRVLTALPVFNEESHVLPVLAEVARYADDIVVIDDGSTDQTADLLAQIRGIRVIRHARNSGYGAGLRSAFQLAIREKYEVLITIDCDGQHQPNLIPELARAVRIGSDHPVDIVSGSRYLQVFAGDSVPPADRRRVNMTITEILNKRLGLLLTDSFCGFKAYRVAALPVLDITELGYAMPLQLWVQAVAAQLTIEEFPVPLVYLEEHRSFGGSLDVTDQRQAYYLQVIERELALHPVVGRN